MFLLFWCYFFLWKIRNEWNFKGLLNIRTLKILLIKNQPDSDCCDEIERDLDRDFLCLFFLWDFSLLDSSSDSDEAYTIING